MLKKSGEKISRPGTSSALSPSVGDDAAAGVAGVAERHVVQVALAKPRREGGRVGLGRPRPGRGGKKV